MIADVIAILQQEPYFGVSKNIEIAKGKNERVTTIKEGYNKIKRIWLSRKILN
jgi:hypothetical protein